MDTELLIIISLKYGIPQTNRIILVGFKGDYFEKIILTLKIKNRGPIQRKK